MFKKQQHMGDYSRLMKQVNFGAWEPGVQKQIMEGDEITGRGLRQRKDGNYDMVERQRGKDTVVGVCAPVFHWLGAAP